MHGLVLAKYGARAASTRQRVVQMVPYLAREGITIDISPLFDDACLEALFTRGKYGFWNSIRAYAKRFWALLGCRKYDFIWVQYELFPYLPACFETLLRLAKKPIIVDYDDAIFHQYDQHKNPLIRRLLGKKLIPLLQASDIAFCGNAYLENYVKQYCKRTEIIPTTVDVETYFPLASSPTEKPVLGWIGSPSTWSYCVPLADLFTFFVETEQASMLVVGAGKKQHPFTSRDWVEEREVADIQSMDIGIMPLNDDPWARGKCGYKLIQYMACGLPVIASPVGVNAEMVEHGVNGFLATTEAEWRSAIETVLADADLRKRMGQAGRAKVEKHYSTQHTASQVVKRIQELLGVIPFCID